MARRSGLGLVLALITVTLWGILPIALKALLATLDPWTLTWFRFLVAGLVLAAWLAVRRRLIPLARPLRRRAGLLLLAAVGLTGNYTLYLLGLSRITPTTAQVVIQVAPMMLLLGGVFVLGERFSRNQWVGVTLLLLGLGLFFNRRLWDLFGQHTQNTAGILLVLLSGAVWSVHGLAQKRLSRDLPSDGILVVLYLAGALLLSLPARPDAITRLAPLPAGLLAFCVLNTLLAYGAFAEALRHWETSRVSAVISTAPLVTMAGVALGHVLWPAVVPAERIDTLGLLGALLVVAGSMTAALGGGR